MNVSTYLLRDKFGLVLIMYQPCKILFDEGTDIMKIYFI